MSGWRVVLGRGPRGGCRLIDGAGSSKSLGIYMKCGNRRMVILDPIAAVEMKRVMGRYRDRERIGYINDLLVN